MNIKDKNSWTLEIITKTWPQGAVIQILQIFSNTSTTQKGVGCFWLSCGGSLYLPVAKGHHGTLLDCCVFNTSLCGVEVRRLQRILLDNEQLHGHEALCLSRVVWLRRCINFWANRVINFAYLLLSRLYNTLSLNRGKELVLCQFWDKYYRSTL